MWVNLYIRSHWHIVLASSSKKIHLPCPVDVASDSLSGLDQDELPSVDIICSPHPITSCLSPHGVNLPGDFPCATLRAELCV